MENNKHVLLSHSSEDTIIADSLKKLFSKITLGQLEVWFSSDKSPLGGIIPGRWYEQIHEKLQNSKIIIVLLTPKSIHNRWIHFEAGFGAGTDCNIIPVCVGIGIDDVPLPLKNYQCYQLSDYESLKIFVGKILENNKIKFDEELTKTILEKNLSTFTQSTVTKNENKQSVDNLNDAVTEIKSHLDEKLTELKSKSGNYEQYSIEIKINLNSSQRLAHVTVTNKRTVQDVLDNIYHLISNSVPVFTYMGKWILEDVISKRKLVIREVGGMIPATYIFRKNSSWRVICLDKPYSALDSADPRRWHGNKLYE